MQSQEVLLLIRLPVSIKYDEEARCFASYCAPLDLYSAGKTEKDAHAAIESAIHMFVRLCFQRNILDDFLTKRGFTISPRLSLADVRRTDPLLAVPAEQPKWFIAQIEFGGKTDQVEVPFPLLSTLGGGAKGADACPA